MATSTFNIGLKTLKRIIEEANSLHWYKSKLSEQLFKGEEIEVFKWAQSHVGSYHSLPSTATLEQQFPFMKSVDCPEPVKYYTDLLDRRFTYDQINAANMESQSILKEDKSAVDDAEKLLKDALDRIREQKYRTRILDVSLEAPKLVVNTYHKIGVEDSNMFFGWPYMDTSTGGAVGGDVVSIIGRPAAGKTWMVLYIAIHNWLMGRNVLFASMEMNTLAVAQRIAAMYSHSSISQLKLGAFSSNSYELFYENMKKMKTEPGKLFVVDGNLAAYADDLYMLAAQMKCHGVVIDGAYLMRHRNARLDRFTKVSENVELMKQLGTDLNIPTFASWQFNRQATKKAKVGMKTEKAGLEDIGYSDAIGQVSSIVLGLNQEDSVETLNSRQAEVMKGRSGEVGSFNMHWDFMKMNFGQIMPEDSKSNEKLDYL